MKSLRPLLSLLFASAISTSSFAAVNGWLNWRGPNQNGSSSARNLPSTLNAKETLWTADFPGMSTPVIANGKLYIMGYVGEGPELQEGVACFDAESGKLLWQKVYPDFLSDTIYLRYATSSPTVDEETGNVYIQDTQGIFAGFTADGKPLWEHSLMEEFGRLTFPNGRTASPVVDKDLVITRGITANWGAQGPGADRFYAFDKKTGEPVWASNPGDRPKDNSYSHPVLGWLDGKRVFYSATGDGSVVCVNARTGEPIFRVPLFKAGINSSLLLHGNSIIAIYGTPYEPGQMVALKIPSVTPTNSAEPIVVPRSKVEQWSNEIRTSASSPVLVGDRVYVTSEVGYLVCVDANTGRVMWNLKLGTEQRNSSPLFADGKIFAPILNDPAVNEGGDEVAGGHGALYVVEPTDTEGKVISKATLDGRCYGTPTAWNGKIYIQTAKKLYCFGKKGGSADVASQEPAWPEAGAATQLQAIPNEMLLHPGETKDFHVRSLDKNGLTVKDVPASSVKWDAFIPPTAKVRATMKGSFDAEGKFTAAPDKVPSAGAFEAQSEGLKGYIRGRVLPGLPIKQDFESFMLSETTSNSVEEPTKYAYPPLPWIGARFKFEVREKDGSKCLVKTVDNTFFRRAMVFMGSPALKNYTIEADVMSEGNKRKMSDVGVINQRYLIRLKGNEQALEITSNQELLSARVSFKWTPNTWYRLKARVDVAADGSGIVRAKAWKRGDAEPEKWTNEVPVKIANQNGSPGLSGFSPQDMRVFIDNISVTAN
ncbi:MAG: Pyrrolo-quinoline quinone repeat-containing protein [Verrucomicrobiales bacterium]|nr:Pyrrolo-quinoline quinone repeat-containing protein [Verrucomicrobiales bacterium]